MKTSGILQDATGKAWARFWNAHEAYGAIVADCEITDMPLDARAVFQEHEARVLNQELSFVDELERKIGSYGLSVIWDDDQQPTNIFDVQLPSGGISFRIGKTGF